MYFFEVDSSLIFILIGPSHSIKIIHSADDPAPTHVRMLLRKLLIGSLPVLQLICCQEATAQELRKFMAFASIGTSPNSSVVFPAWSVEPSYFIKQPKLSFGLRIEAFDKPGVERNTSLTISTNYYLRKYALGKINLFFGVGIGAYGALKEDTVLRTTTIGGATGILLSSVEGVNKVRLGFYPRLGASYRHLTIMFEYNFIYRERLICNYCFTSYTSSTCWTTPYYYRSGNYFSFKFGYLFYTRRKEPLRP